MKLIISVQTTLVSVQFHRSFPGPAEVSPAEITALAQYYYDLATGLHNYLQFHNDIVSFDGGEGGATTLEIMPTAPKVTYMYIYQHRDWDSSDYCGLHYAFQKSEVASLDEIFQKIQDAIYKNGIRTTEFFRDHDKLRSGVITENQVVYVYVTSHSQKSLSAIDQP